MLSRWTPNEAKTYLFGQAVAAGQAAGEKRSQQASQDHESQDSTRKDSKPV
jgi:hypothetical protein